MWQTFMNLLTYKISNPQLPVLAIVGVFVVVYLSKLWHKKRVL